MLTDMIRLTAAAFYGSIPQKAESITQDRDFTDTVRFLCALSSRIHRNDDGSFTVEPAASLPTPGSVTQFNGFSKSSALFFSAAAANIGCTFRFADIKNGVLTRVEADALSEYVRGILQIGVAPNGFAAASANLYETTGCIAHEPIEFAAGLLTTLPLCAGNPCFALGQYEGNEVLESAYERLVRYGLVTKRKRDIIYVKSVRQSVLYQKSKKAGRPKKTPTETENA